jgi:hypothetical protein
MVASFTIDWGIDHHGEILVARPVGDCGCLVPSLHFQARRIRRTAKPQPQFEGDANTYTHPLRGGSSECLKTFAQGLHLGNETNDNDW